MRVCEIVFCVCCCASCLNMLVCQSVVLVARVWVVCSCECLYRLCVCFACLFRACVCASFVCFVCVCVCVVCRCVVTLGVVVWVVM